LGFIATELSQTEVNFDFWLISDDPNLGEEPKFHDADMRYTPHVIPVKIPCSRMIFEWMAGGKGSLYR